MKKMLEFDHIAAIWIDDITWIGLSLGIHIAFEGRIDIHILKWIVSFGKIPIYRLSSGKKIAVSNSYHTAVSSKQRIEYHRPRL